MYRTILVAYATKHGSTREVAETIAGVLRADGYDVTVRPAADVAELDGVGAVVLGGALYTGRWHRDARRFLSRFHGELATRGLAIFGMGPKTMSTEDVAGSRDQLGRALQSFGDLRPVAMAVFGGVIDPSRLRFPFSHLPASDARDWRQIRRWATEIGVAFAGERATA
jgi:menaquinone-dependent protoporphyrinogen oxidase